MVTEKPALDAIPVDEKQLSAVCDELKRLYARGLREYMEITRCPAKYVRDCHSAGMTENETRAAIRASAQCMARDERQKELQSMARLISPRLNGEDFERGYCSAITAALKEVFGDPEPEDELPALLKYLTSQPMDCRRKQRHFESPFRPGDFSHLIILPDRIEGVFGDVGATDVTGINIGWVAPIFSFDDPDFVQLTQVKRIPPRLAKAKYHGLEWPHCLLLQLGRAHRITGFESDAICVGSATGKPHSWISNRRFSLVDTGEIRQIVQKALGLQLSARYEWTADLQIDEGPSVRLLLGPHEAKEMFRLREIEDGVKRRAALLHLVRRHFRRRRCSKREAIEIREHLRGREAFEWFGVRGRIQPSQFDRERLGAVLEDSTRTVDTIHRHRGQMAGTSPLSR